MLAMLARLVDIDSGSHHKSGVDRVGQAICDFLDDHNIPYDVTAHTTFGNAIRATVNGGEGRPVLLMGHRDTVFPDGEARRRPFRVEGRRAYGPGVADMKAGLVMNSFVAAALHECGGAPAPLVVLYTADEEIGSPSSRPLIEAQARNARVVLNAEPGRPNGAIVTGRKAGIFMRFEVQGKAAHSGANFEQGASAIAEIAHKIVALHALTDLAKGITVNVGIVAGGQTVNTVAPTAHGEIDLRYIAAADREAMTSKVEAIMDRATVPGTSARFVVYGEFLPLLETAESKRLFDLYAECGQSVGLTVSREFTGGCSDAGFAASTGAPTICGVGPIGARAHSPDEYLELDSMLPRSQALALTVVRSAAQFA